jgi:hypothetical protein
MRIMEHGIKALAWASVVLCLALPENGTEVVNSFLNPFWQRCITNRWRDGGSQIIPPFSLAQKLNYLVPFPGKDLAPSRATSVR